MPPHHAIVRRAELQDLVPKVLGVVRPRLAVQGAERAMAQLARAAHLAAVCAQRDPNHVCACAAVGIPDQKKNGAVTAKEKKRDDVGTIRT